MPASTRRRRLRVPVVAYAHPFELGIGAAFVILGLKGLIAGHSSPSVDSLPEVSLVLYRVAQVVAGVGILIGLALRDKTLGRAIERAACYVLGSALLAFALLVVGRNGSAGWDVGLVCTFIGLACIARARAIRKTEQVINATLAQVAADPVALRRLVDGRPPYRSDEEV
jgi:phosphoglycerol transferase MdoB-like AlkP superfamily enzyme